MPVATITEGRDLIYTRFKTAWDASAYVLVPVFYKDAKGSPPPNTSWLRCTATHTAEQQVTIGGDPGNRRYRVRGIVTVQIFTPFGDGQDVADAMARVVKLAFRGKRTGLDSVTFRNARVMDGTQDGQWLQTNVMAEFDYDEID